MDCLYSPFSEWSFAVLNDSLNSSSCANTLFVTNNEIGLTDAYKDYAVWRYFTGNKAINGEFFNEANNYCTSTIVSEFEGDFEITSNKGGAYFFDLPLELLTLNLITSSPSMLNLVHLVVNDNGIETNASYMKYCFFIIFYVTIVYLKL